MHMLDSFVKLTTKTATSIEGIQSLCPVQGFISPEFKTKDRVQKIIYLYLILNPQPDAGSNVYAVTKEGVPHCYVMSADMVPQLEPCDGQEFYGLCFMAGRKLKQWYKLKFEN